MPFRYVLPALAFAGCVVAQCGDGDPITIRSASDLTALASCGTYNGNIIIDESVTGAISISGIQQIRGDLICNGAKDLNTISADRLQTITGALDLQELQTLSTLQMDYLSSVGSINFIGLPNLQTLQFTRGVVNATTVYISNTNLRDLKGIELTKVDNMNINNNNQLNTVNVNNLKNVSTALSFSANGPNLNVMLPNLVGAANLTFRAVNSVTIPSLVEVPGYVGFYDSTFNNVSAANLTRISETLAVVGCPELVEANFPMLNLVRGGLVVANNSVLKSIEGFPALSKIGGAIDLYGTFDAADLPALTDVRGGATILTRTENSTLCQSFNNYKTNKVIAGRVNCSTNADDPIATNGTSSNSTTDKNAASAMTGSSSMAVPAVVAVIAALLL